MQAPQLLFEYSPWFIILCLAIGVFYAFVLYQSTGPWGLGMNRVLAALRMVTASILCFLLLGPFLKQLINSTEEPTFIIALDNSTSITQVVDSSDYNNYLKSINELTTQLAEKDYNIVIKDLDQTTLEQVTSVDNSGKSTNLNRLFKSIQSDYEGKNLDGVLLVSDGIYNQGLSPTFSPYNFNIYTVGLGDTIPKQDIKLRSIYYNKIAYQGNRFPLVAEVINSGFVNREAIVRVLKDGSEIGRQGILFNGDNELKRIDFTLEANTNGIQHYRVEVLPLSEESVYSNNYKDAYIDVVEGKEKILLIGLAPHPDIKALASTIETNENYELTLHIPGINDLKEDKYDLVIFHQAFDRYNRNNQLIKKFLDAETPLWFIAGNQTNINTFNQLNGLINITVSRNQRDMVRPAHNRGFNRFQISGEDYNSTLADYPPVIVPFGKTELTQGGEVLLYQQVGSIVTNKPLLAVHESGNQKIAVMVGEGFWQWRTREFARNERYQTFDEMITKLIQFLSAKEDKRKFRVYPIENEFYDTEDVIFETEIYNDIYERVYGDEIQLSITNESGDKSEYSYVTSPANSQFRVNGLEQGIYQYSGSREINGITEYVSGEFSVTELQIESINLTANHSVLRKLSKNSGGEFYLPQELDKLKESLLDREPQGVIYTSESFLPIINLKWPFFLLLALLSVEWFIRKYNGAY